jgi:hypothetical protein
VKRTSSPLGSIGDQGSPYRLAREQQGFAHRPPPTAHREAHIVLPERRYGGVMGTPETRTRNSWAGTQQNIVLLGKLYRLSWEIFGLGPIVPPRKNCRPRREILASSLGSNTVLHGNIYRPLAENISSRQGKFIVMFGKTNGILPANSRVSVCAMTVRLVFVYVKCLLCVYRQKSV